jgi:3-hydroxymyristoyl/3-hydroxydecanoyl-(acyl carrier protein) dehydratase
MKLDRLHLRVIECDPGRVVVGLRADFASGFFDGHFPDLPLLPGVIQTHLAVKIFEVHAGQVGPFRGFKNLKFFNPIFPGQDLVLECSRNPQTGALSFHYHHEGKTFAKGTVLL